MVELHQSRGASGQGSDAQGDHQARIDALRQEAHATREFLAREKPRCNRQGKELKSNVTDNDSAKMATSKGVIQGYEHQRGGAIVFG